MNLHLTDLIERFNEDISLLLTVLAVYSQRDIKGQMNLVTWLNVHVCLGGRVDDAAQQEG